MAQFQQPFHVTTQLHEADVRGGLNKPSPHCIAYKLSQDTVTSLLNGIAKKPTPPEATVYTVSADWIASLAASIANDLSKRFNSSAETYQETGRNVANIISSVGNGTWSPGITPVNAIRDIETNFPLYISDYFDQLSGWSRERCFDDKIKRIGSDISGTTSAGGHNGPEPALDGIYAKISLKLPAVNPLHFNTSSQTPTFSQSGEASSGEVYRYFAFIDTYKRAVSMNKDGSITGETYDFTDPAQLWRIDDYGGFYALYNKKYNKYLGSKLAGTDSKPNSNGHESAVYIVENTDTSTYSIGHAQQNKINYHDILKDLTLVTVPLVAWRNSSGQFLSVDEAHDGGLSFTNGNRHSQATIPNSGQLFLFVPHPDFSNKAVVIGNNGKFIEFNPSASNKVSASYDLKSIGRLPLALFDYDQNIWPSGANYLASRLQQPLISANIAAPQPGTGTRVRVWKADPSVKSVGIRELYLPRTDIESGPQDSFLAVNAPTDPISPDDNGDFLLDFDDEPAKVPESDNHTRFDTVHTFASVRYTYDLIIGDLEYLDGKPPQLTRPWGNKKLTIHPHAGEDANAFYSREGVLKFFYTSQRGNAPIYLCRSIDVVAHEAGHSILDILQPGWLANGQAGGFHEAFGDLCSLFVLISMADIADLFVTLTKANLRDPENFLSAVGEEFGELLRNKTKGLRNLSNTLKGSQADAEVHALSLVFSGYYYDVLADVYGFERNPAIKSDTETLMDVGTILRRALIIAIRTSSARPSRTLFVELATNVETALGTLGRRLGLDLTKWKESVRTRAKERELSIAGLRRGIAEARGVGEERLCGTMKIALNK